MPLISLSMRRKSWEGFQKTVARIDSNTFTSLPEVYSCTRETILKKVSLLIVLFCISQKWSDSANSLKLPRILSSWQWYYEYWCLTFPACHHVTSPTTNNSALTLQCNDKKHSNSRHGMACRILKVGYTQTFLFAFQYNYRNCVQPRERRSLHRRNFPTPSLIQSSLLHYNAWHRRAHQHFRHHVRQKNLSRTLRCVIPVVCVTNEREENVVKQHN